MLKIYKIKKDLDLKVLQFLEKIKLIESNNGTSITKYNDLT